MPWSYLRFFDVYMVSQEHLKHSSFESINAPLYRHIFISKTCFNDIFMVQASRMMQNIKEIYFTNLELFWNIKYLASCTHSCRFFRRKSVCLNICWYCGMQEEASRISRSHFYLNYTVNYSHPWSSMSQMRKDLQAVQQWKAWRAS